MLLANFEQQEFTTLLARQCWRRVESLTKQGTPEWLNARLGVISTTVQLNELNEARKLLGITKALYQGSRWFRIESPLHGPRKGSGFQVRKGPRPQLTGPKNNRSPHRRASEY